MDNLVKDIFEKLGQREWTIATAESCTGGMIAARITDVPGSSYFLDRGYVTYSNQAKMETLNVPAVLIDDHGAVSPEVAEAMAKGALEAAGTDIAVAVTGIAGPGGGTDEKPVGLVYVGVATWEDVQTSKHVFEGDRDAIRKQTVEAALRHVLTVLQ